MVGHHRKYLGHGCGELLGLPGVGKSWIAQNGSGVFPLKAKLLLVPQGWTAGKLKNVINGIWIGRALIPVIIHLLVTNVAGPWRRHIRSAFLIFERIGRQAREKGYSEQIIHDEGILQALWSLVLHLGLTGNNVENIAELFRRTVKLIGYVYYVSCPRNMYVDRVCVFSASSDDIGDIEAIPKRECMAFVLRQVRKVGVKIRMVNNIRNLSKGIDTQRLFVSVVIPMRNEVAYIKNCLLSLLNNDYPSELIEILVVDGVSSDGSREIVAELIKTNTNIRLLSNPERITPTALNVGIEEAMGDVIVRMDVHAIYPPDYIGHCVDDLLKYGADNVGGLWDIQPGAETRIAKAIALAQSHPVGVGNVAYRTGSEGLKWVDTVPYGCYKKEVLKRLGGFDPELIRNQDDELNARLRKAGGKILLDPSIQCTYFARSTLGQVGRMFYQYGYFKPLAAHKVGKVYTIRQLAPPVFVSLVMLLAIGAMFSSTVTRLLLILLLIYLIIITLAAMTVGLRSNIRVALWLPVVFAIMHFAYGIGSLRGMADLFVRKKKPRDAPLTR